MVKVGVPLETTAQAGSEVADAGIAVFGAEAMHLSTAPVVEVVVADIILTERDALVTAATATRA